MKMINIKVLSNFNFQMRNLSFHIFMKGNSKIYTAWILNYYLQVSLNNISGSCSYSEYWFETVNIIIIHTQLSILKASLKGKVVFHFPGFSLALRVPNKGNSCIPLFNIHQLILTETNPGHKPRLREIHWPSVKTRQTKKVNLGALWLDARVYYIYLFLNLFMNNCSVFIYDINF